MGKSPIATFDGCLYWLIARRRPERWPARLLETHTLL
jgi:hypothetical protein